MTEPICHTCGDAGAIEDYGSGEMVPCPDCCPGEVLPPDVAACFEKMMQQQQPIDTGAPSP